MRSILIVLVLLSVTLQVRAKPDHWAYQPPHSPAVPVVERASRATNPIDAFVLRRLNEEGLSPSPMADRARLARRVHFDLCGLPPSIEELDAYLSDTRPGAYERLVDRLTGSPHYGEHWARHWLDLARYADSNGFQRDGHRQIWAYRDWVVDAFNADFPFDEFTIEQLAGDLLPDASLSQRIATGFNRCTTVNVEGGVDREEDRVNGVIDRVNTLGTVWLGTTLECAQCHDHKYDPISQREYYELFAFFNSTPMETVGKGESASRIFTGPKLSLPVSPDRERKWRALKTSHDVAVAAIESRKNRLRAEQADWERKLLSDAQARALVRPDILLIIALPLAERTAGERLELGRVYFKQDESLEALAKTEKALRTELEGVEPPTSLVMVEMEKARQTRVFKRGSFLSPGAKVVAKTPLVLHDFPADSTPDRLGLARWIAHAANPLTARVVVNRFWNEFFGRGLVETLEDFGSQSSPPSHADLLDWLASEFVRCGWSTKAVHRAIVLSRTYRQSSRVTPEALERDPENRFYARGPRFRLSAENLRDNALSVSGLLSLKARGPAVRPVQPENLWSVTGLVDNTYRTSTGEDLYRRGLYVYWRRSSPYPSFVNFDAPDRGACTVRRPRTNTPLQALTLLNDPAYVETAWALAKRLLTDLPDADRDARIARGFRLCVSRFPTSTEHRVLSDAFEGELARLEANPGLARKISSSSPHGRDAELVAWFYVASLLLNLDETISKG